MNEEIITKTSDLLNSLKNEDIDETTMAKTLVICQLINHEHKRIEQGGEVDYDAMKTFARIFDKFSAVFLQKGIDSNICETMNKVANDLRKYHKE